MYSSVSLCSKEKYVGCFVKSRLLMCLSLNICACIMAGDKSSVECYNIVLRPEGTEHDFTVEVSVGIPQVQGNMVSEFRTLLECHPGLCPGKDYWPLGWCPES